MKQFHFPVLDSTLTRAQELARRHPAQPLLVSAQTQTHGRGRSGRPWASPDGGAWFTIAWPAQAGLSATHYAPVPLIAGLCVYDAVAPILGGGHELRIKWPNDLLLDGRKVAGILCERVLLAPAEGDTGAAGSSGDVTVAWASAHANAEGDANTADNSGGAYLLIGIGINVNVDPADLGGDLHYPATSILAAIGSKTDVRVLIDACVQRLVERMAELEREGFSPAVRDVIQSRLAWRGQPVSLHLENQPIVGICRGLDAAGRLELEIAGKLKSFDAGEVQACRSSEFKI